MAGLTVERIRRIQLSPRPITQQVLAEAIINIDYRVTGAEIEVEGFETLLRDRPYFLAMNHTDTYNYFPILCELHRAGRYGATWVKGKYYEHWFTGGFMDLMNQIPLASRGYLLATGFQDHTGRRPGNDEYRLLRDVAEGRLPVEAALDAGGDVRAYVQARGGQGFADQVEEDFAALMREVVRINEQAFEIGLFVMVFPQGTRSKRLSKGHTGLMQVAQHLGHDIIPVGCSGSDKLYPTNRPYSTGSKVVYRVGEPLRLDGPELGQWRVTEPFTPLTRAATLAHGDHFEHATDALMNVINGLVDEEYQFAPDLQSDGVSGIDRFV